MIFTKSTFFILRRGLRKITVHSVVNDNDLTKRGITYLSYKAFKLIVSKVQRK
jgi:hypothetical protein